MEKEAAARLMHSNLLLVHQSLPVPEVLEKAKAKIEMMKGLFGRLAEILRECPGQYYRYHGDWRSETQTVVSLLAFLHWLETGNLLMHAEAEKKLGCEVEDLLEIPTRSSGISRTKILASLGVAVTGVAIAFKLYFSGKK